MPNSSIRSLKSWILFLCGTCVLLSACSSGQVREPIRSSPASVEAIGSFAEVANGDSAIVGHIGGPATSIHARGDYAYLGHSTEFAVVDISDPTRPTRIGYLLISALDMVVEENVAYVAGRDGLAIVDISTPTEPRALSFLPTGHSAIGIAKEGDTVYLAVHTEGIHVVDVTEVSRPRLTNTTPIAGRVAGVAVYRKHAYVVTNSGFHILDVTDETKPIKVGVFEADRPAFSLTVSENIAYMGVSGSILAVDVTDPARPVEIERFPMAGTPLRLTVRDDFLYAAAVDGLGTVKVATHTSNDMQSEDSRAWASAPTGWIDLPGATWDVVTTTDGHVFVADGTSGMRSIRLAGVEGTEQIGRYAVPDAAQTVSVEAALAYVVDGNGQLWTIDVSRPDDPTARDRLRSLYFIHDVYSDHNVVYLSASHVGYSLRTMSMSPLPDCEDIGTLKTGGLVTSIAATSDIAYLAVENTGLQVVDMRRPCDPLSLGTLPISGVVSDLVVVDQLAYLAAEGGENWVVDVSDPRNPALVSALALGESTDSLAFGDGHLYATTSLGNVRIVKIAPGSAPVEVASFNIGDRIHEIAILDDRLYLATTLGLQIYDVSEKGKPVLYALHSVPGGIEDFDVAAGIVYAAGGSEGLYIIQTEFDPNQRFAETGHGVSN